MASEDYSDVVLPQSLLDTDLYKVRGPTSRS